MYKVQEPRTTNQEERWREVRELCLELFNKILRVPIKEEDVKKFVRLGKMNSVQERKPRPFLIQFRDRVLKNMIMESLGKLKDADEIFKKIIFTHVMTMEDREEYKRLVNEAKAKQGDDLSG